MLPIATTGQIKDGYVGGNLTIDLSEYMKKKDGATKTELQSLTDVVANKLDATPIHKHDVADIKELQEKLDSKYDTSKQYSYNTILSDSEKIPFIESPKMLSMEIASQFDMDGYRFYVDNSSGDLMITLNDIAIFKEHRTHYAPFYFRKGLTFFLIFDIIISRYYDIKMEVGL